MQGLTRETRRALKRARRKRAAELNIVSMIDILTVLVFFLLVNAAGMSIIGINLPDGNASSPPDKPPFALTVTIRKTGLEVWSTEQDIQSFPVQGTEYDFLDLARYLRDIKTRHPDQLAITLQMEPDINYDSLVHLMDAVRVEPSESGHGNQDLFPQISLGDAPPPGTDGGAQ